MDLQDRIPLKQLEIYFSSTTITAAPLFYAPEVNWKRFNSLYTGHYYRLLKWKIID